MSKATSLYWGRKVAALEASLLFATAIKLNSGCFYLHILQNLKIVTHNFK